VIVRAVVRSRGGVAYALERMTAPQQIEVDSHDQG